jgi:hypothetical protein
MFLRCCAANAASQVPGITVKLDVCKGFFLRK